MEFTEASGDVLGNTAPDTPARDSRADDDDEEDSQDGSLQSSQVAMGIDAGLAAAMGVATSLAGVSRSTGTGTSYSVDTANSSAASFATPEFSNGPHQSRHSSSQGRAASSGASVGGRSYGPDDASDNLSDSLKKWAAAAEQFAEMETASRASSLRSFEKSDWAVQRSLAALSKLEGPPLQELDGDQMSIPSAVTDHSAFPSSKKMEKKASAQVWTTIDEAIEQSAKSNESSGEDWAGMAKTYLQDDDPF
uniref:Uncharacterized protein n=1 Tax=Grammatophora oceanica TaxID=210454 RepID=A0A7S1UUR8_9STRA